MSEATPCNSCLKRPRDAKPKRLRASYLSIGRTAFRFNESRAFPRQPTAAILAEIKAPKRKNKKVIARGNIQDPVTLDRIKLERTP
jgi:hypothetical protein